MMTRLSDIAAKLCETFLWIAFACLIVTVGLQVLTRNVLHIPMIWTGDVAQLLFAWLIFIGAALGLRRGVHYTVEVLPMDRPFLRIATFWIGFAATLGVVYLMVWHGWTLASIRASGTVQSLGISRFWMFAPFPISGILMLLFMIEAALGGEALRPPERSKE